MPDNNHKSECERRRKRLKDQWESIPFFSFKDESCSLCRDEGVECLVAHNGASICQRCAVMAFEPTQEEIDEQLQEALDNAEENLNRIMWDVNNGKDERKPN